MGSHLYKINVIILVKEPRFSDSVSVSRPIQFWSSMSAVILVAEDLWKICHMAKATVFHIKEYNLKTDGQDGAVKMNMTIL